MSEREMNTQSLLRAWEKGVEDALDDLARADELSDKQLDNVAGMHVVSGLKGGIWGGVTEGHDTCTCGPTWCW